MERCKLNIKNHMNTLKQYYNYFKLCWLSLTYNNYGSKLDTMIEPIFSISHFALLWFGPVSYPYLKVIC